MLKRFNLLQYLSFNRRPSSWVMSHEPFIDIDSIDIAHQIVY